MHGQTNIKHLNILSGYEKSWLIELLSASRVVIYDETESLIKYDL
jgi:hypothetical protein